MTIFFGMGDPIWDGIEIYFCSIKKIRDEIEIFFYPTYLYETGVELINSITSLLIANLNYNFHVTCFPPPKKKKKKAKCMFIIRRFNFS